MILLTLSRGKGEETVRLQLPASPAEIGETFAFLDRISLDTTATAILDVSSNVPVLYRCLYDVDVEDSEQFQKLQKLAERTEALSPAKAAIFSGALDAECVWNLEGALTVADRLDEYMLVNNVSSDSELGIYLVNKGITPFPDRFKPYINYARVGAEYREKHGGEYSSGNYVQKKTPELLENERLDGVFRIWMENPCPVRVQSETAQITLPATFEQLESARQLLGVDSLNMAKLTRVEALRPYLGEYLPLQGMDLRLEQLDELAENIRIGTPACGGDVHLVHQAVDALARAGKLRADQVIQAVQPKGGITLMQAQQPAFQFLILLPAQRGFAAQPFVVPAAGDLQQSAYKFHRGPRAGRTDVPVLVLYGLESMPTDFFRMSMTPSFSSSFLRSARISASSSRRRLASRFWRSACPGDGAPAAFSQLRSVSMQMPSSAATSRLGRPCSVTIRTAPALKASS